jgi:hypothetical protein
MQVHLRPKMKVSGSKGRCSPMVNAMCHYLPDSRREVKALLVKF